MIQVVSHGSMNNRINKSTLHTCAYCGCVFKFDYSDGICETYNDEVIHDVVHETYVRCPECGMKRILYATYGGNGEVMHEGNK